MNIRKLFYLIALIPSIAFAILEDVHFCGNTINFGSKVDMRRRGGSMHDIPVLDQDGVSYSYSYTASTMSSAWLRSKNNPNSSSDEVISPLFSAISSSAYDPAAQLNSTEWANSKFAQDWLQTTEGKYHAKRLDIDTKEPLASLPAAKLRRLKMAARKNTPCHIVEFIKQNGSCKLDDVAHHTTDQYNRRVFQAIDLPQLEDLPNSDCPSNKGGTSEQYFSDIFSLHRDVIQIWSHEIDRLADEVRVARQKYESYLTPDKKFILPGQSANYRMAYNSFADRYEQYQTEFNDYNKSVQYYNSAIVGGEFVPEREKQLYANFKRRFQRAAREYMLNHFYQSKQNVSVMEMNKVTDFLFYETMESKKQMAMMAPSCVNIDSGSSSQTIPFLENSQSSSFLSTNIGFLSESPEPRCKGSDINDELNYMQFRSPVNNIKRINHLLNQDNPQPITVSICPVFFTEPEYRGRSEKNYCLDTRGKQVYEHNVLVIGRRIYKGKCQFLLRNSVGNECNAYVSPHKETCLSEVRRTGNADVWIDAQALVNNTHNVNWLE